MTDREAMQQALDALELLARYENPATKVQVRKPRNGGPIVTMYPHKVATEAAAPLRERLAQPEQCQYPNCKCATENPCLKGLAQPKQEPVSGVVLDEHGLGALVKNGSEDWHCKNRNARRLYTTPPQGIYYTPPQRTWVGLTDEQIRDLWSWSMTAEAERTANTQQHAFARAIEAKLKEKNT